MDRIREAITRAKDARSPARAAPRSVPAEQAPRAARAPGAGAASAAESAPVVACDVARFSERRIISNEQDPILNNFKVLRTKVLQRAESEGWRSIAIVSPGSGAGKTVTAINLAITLGSKAGILPTLVDLDFYRPSVARYLGLRDFNSSLDYFEGKRPLCEVVVRPDIADMLLIPNERVTRRGAEHLTSERADGLISGVMEDYGSQLAIFDMSPLLGCDDSLAFLPKIDCVLVVAASGQTLVKELKEAKRLLADTPILGTVLNKAPRSLMPNQYY